MHKIPFFGSRSYIRNLRRKGIDLNIIINDPLTYWSSYTNNSQQYMQRNITDSKITKETLRFAFNGTNSKVYYYNGQYSWVHIYNSSMVSANSVHLADGTIQNITQLPKYIIINNQMDNFNNAIWVSLYHTLPETDNASPFFRTSTWINWENCISPFTIHTYKETITSDNRQDDIKYLNGVLFYYIDKQPSTNLGKYNEIHTTILRQYNSYVSSTTRPAFSLLT